MHLEKFLQMDRISELFNTTLFQYKSFNLTLERLTLAALVLVIGLITYLIIKRLVNGAIRKELFTKEKSKAIIRFTRFLFIITTIIFFFKALGLDTSKVISYPILKTEKVSFSLFHLLILYIIIFTTRLVLFFLEFYLNKRAQTSKVEKGKSSSLFQIIKYFVWVIAMTLFLETLGFSITFLIASLSALLVGLGLGIQHFFNDLVSGIVILFDQSIKVGDIVEVQGEMVGKITEINLRTSKIISRDDVIVIVPNSMFTSDRVINWSHNTFKTRFNVDVGVAYGSDVEKVKHLLIEAAMEHPKIDNHPEPLVLFSNFGDSSLDFSLLFFTDESFRVERIKSDLRFAINQKFINNNVTIPFPQRDVHLIKSKE